MKKITQAMMMALALGVWGLAAVAQPSDAPPPGEGPPPPDGPPGGPGRGHFRPPLITVLDANGDGIISADEIANASAALKKLDKNGDGQLTRDEYMGRGTGPRGKRPPGGPSGPGAGTDTSGQGKPPPSGDQPPHDGPPGAQGQGAPGNGNFHPAMPPLVAALDANGDGIISAEEIANAPAALKALDKNGDGQLTPDEYMPKGRRPGGPNGHRPPPEGGEQQNPPPGNQ